MYPKRTEYGDRRINDCLGVGKGLIGNVNGKEGVALLGDANVLKLDCGNHCTTP